MHLKKSVQDINHCHIFTIFLYDFPRLHQRLFAESTVSSCQSLLHLAVLGSSRSYGLQASPDSPCLMERSPLLPMVLGWDNSMPSEALNGQSQVSISYFPRRHLDTQTKRSMAQKTSSAHQQGWGNEPSRPQRSCLLFSPQGPQPLIFTYGKEAPSVFRPAKRIPVTR